MADQDKFVYRFSEGTKDEGSLGGKGSGLAEMSNLPARSAGIYDHHRGLPRVRDAGEMPESLMESVAEYLGELEESTGKRLGDSEDPLLVSVRSGAAASMPGMMDTVLNLGLNDTAVEGLAHRTDDERFARDSYRRFIQMFGDIVLGIDQEKFEDALNDLKRERGVEEDPDLSAGDLVGLIETYKRIVEEEAERPFPEEPKEQLELAIRAVFDSWNNDRAASYRAEFGIPDDLGTAVTVMSMGVGNMGEGSATGVAFTRDPSTGEQGLYGEFLLNAQGEESCPAPAPEAARRDGGGDAPRFEELLETMQRLEQQYRDMQDVEFTVERDNLYMLQTRSAKRTGVAALKVAYDMAEEGLISREEAVSRIEPDQLNQVLHPYIDPRLSSRCWLRATGLAGAATGGIVLTATRPRRRASGRGAHPGAPSNQSRRRARHGPGHGHPDCPWGHDQPAAVVRVASASPP